VRVLAAYFMPIAKGRGLDRLWISADLSLGDAAGTALVCGLINAGLGAAAAVMQSGPAAARSLEAHCRPLWTPDAKWRVRVRCILRPTLSQAICAAWYAYCLQRDQQRGKPRRGPQPQQGGERREQQPQQGGERRGQQAQRDGERREQQALRDGERRGQRRRGDDHGPAATPS
jgi:hypothetical protein